MGAPLRTGGAQEVALWSRVSGKAPRIPSVAPSQPRPHSCELTGLLPLPGMPQSSEGPSGLWSNRPEEPARVGPSRASDPRP